MDILVVNTQLFTTIHRNSDRVSSPGPNELLLREAAGSSPIIIVDPRDIAGGMLITSDRLIGDTALLLDLFIIPETRRI